MTASDRNLLLLTCRGDDRAARELWSAYAGRLRSYAASIVPRAPDDVVQHVFCRILELPQAQLAAVIDPLAWLLVRTRREALNHLRSERRERRRRTVGGVGAVGDVGGAPSPAQTATDVQAALAALPRALREVVTLRHTTGLSFEQIAEVLGANRNTVAWRYSCGIERLRAVLSPSEVCHA